MRNIKDKVSKKKNLIIFTILSIILVGMLILDLFLHKRDEDFLPDEETTEESENNYDWYMEEDSESTKECEINTTETMMEEYTETYNTEEWAEDSSPINQDFKITGLSEEQKLFIGGEEGVENLKIKMQETMYSHGFYAYTEAEADENIELTDSTIQFFFSVNANVPITIEATYYRITADWVIKTYW